VCRPDFVIDSTFDLFVDLGAPDHLVDFPVSAQSASLLVISSHFMG
jgi:predicted membrane GTPase involved in stress response